MKRGPAYASIGLGGLALSLWVAACTALQLGSHFTAAPGPVGPGHDVERPASAEVAVFVGSAPDGFDWVAGEPEVQVGYRHRLLGRIDLRVDRGLCDGGDGGVLGPVAVFQALRQRARSVGADAVIYVDTQAHDLPRSDCARLARTGASAHERPWATGWAVLLEDEAAPDAGMTDAGQDAGMAAAGQDAGMADVGQGVGGSMTTQDAGPGAPDAGRPAR